MKRIRDKTGRYQLVVKPRKCLHCGKIFRRNGAWNAKYCEQKCYLEARKTKLEYKVDENGCHNCTSHKGDKDGYPKISRMIDGVQKHFRLSRYLWAKRNGEIPKGKYLLHSCDNPKCINLEHLRVGTPQDNSSDAVKRGRINKGTDVSISKLSEANVREIKRLLDTETNTQLASKYDVGKTTIWLIRNGKTWKHIKLKEHYERNNNTN